MAEQIALSIFVHSLDGAVMLPGGGVRVVRCVDRYGVINEALYAIRYFGSH